jgi:hypothetical protein
MFMYILILVISDSEEEDESCAESNELLCVLFVIKFSRRQNSINFSQADSFVRRFIKYLTRLSAR